MRRVNQSRLILAGLAAVALLALRFASPAAAAAGETGRTEVLTNTDVVRMVMAGEDTTSIVEKIRRSATHFDVSTDVLPELRKAGVPEEIIRAMQAAARKSARPMYAPPAESGPQGWIELRFEDDPNGTLTTNSIVFAAKATRRGSLREPQDVDLAFIMMCTDPMHVPDAWAEHTPMDPNFPRHKVLFFHEGKSEAQGKGFKNEIYAVHPDHWRFPADAGVHKGYLAVVARLGDEERYLAAFMTPYENLRVEAGKVTRLHVRARTLPHQKSRKKKRYSVKFWDPTLSAPTMEGTGAPRRLSSLEIVSVDPPEDPASEPAAPAPGKAPE